MFNPWVDKIFWRREWLPNPVIWPGEFHGQRILVGHSLCDHKQSDMTDQKFHPGDFLFSLFFLLVHCAKCVFKIMQSPTLIKISNYLIIIITNYMVYIMFTLSSISWQHCIFYIFRCYIACYSQWPGIICHLLNINIDDTGLYLPGSWRFNNLTIGHWSSLVSSNNYRIYVLSVANPLKYPKFYLLSFSLMLIVTPFSTCFPIMKINPLYIFLERK